MPQLSKETGIPKDTLYGWRRQALQARGLASLEEARAWRQQFVQGDHPEHRHSGIRFVTPIQHQ